MPNKQLICNYLEKLKEILAKLLKYQKLSLAKIEEDENLPWAIDRGVQLMIECCIDIGEEIITGLNFKKPINYRQTFDILTQHGIIPSRLARPIKDLVKYRNELVHDYLIIEVKKNYDILQKDLPKIENYLKVIEKFVKKYV